MQPYIMAIIALEMSANILYHWKGWICKCIKKCFSPIDNFVFENAEKIYCSIDNFVFENVQKCNPNIKNFLFENVLK